MVHDLIFYSHPGKRLEEHIRGVLKNTLHRSSLSIAEIAALFHDVGKINPNFQKKLYGKSEGYANHSSLSVIAFINCALENMDFFKNEIQITSNEEFALFVLQVSVLISKHHAHLPDFEFAFSGSNEFVEAKQFAKENNSLLPVYDFLNQRLGGEYNPFDLVFNDKKKGFHVFSSKLHRKVWQTNALKYFLDTQEAFASLIESDKRDAGDNNNFYFNETIAENTVRLANSLADTFAKFDSVENISELNSFRTSIRLEAINGLKQQLQKGKRVFTLTAPTGAGKTYILLSVADEIRRQKGNLGIIYSLPFLSITEQVQQIAEYLLDKNNVLSVNSKTENVRIDNAQQNYESDQTEENLSKIIKEDFIQNTFDHPFIITTFVQFFETLVSNRNSTLLKLPNFANRIFLIDEVQALPPRLYIFFAAWLDIFCKRNNSYAILSTATMPKIGIPIKDTEPLKRVDLLFKNYCVPEDLVDARKYFEEDIFNRYRINVMPENLNSESLANHILAQPDSCLIILNTIADTKELYEKLSEQAENVLLLNTYFIPDDRTKIIQKAKDLLELKEKFYLISTQLIEAGVDIDFPIVYRDMCPLPSLIQSAGRCNRNKEILLGQVYFFQLVSDNGKTRSSLIYRNEGKQFLDFCKMNIKNGTDENTLFDIQDKFFEGIKNNLTIGAFFPKKDVEENMVECVNNAKYETLGKFKLINNDIGEQQQYYILKDENDSVYEKLKLLLAKATFCKSYEENRKKKIDITSFVKSLNNRILNIRINKYNREQMPQVYREELMGIKFLTNDSYSSQTGLIVNNPENCFL